MISVDLKNVGIIKEAHLGFVPGVNLILGASSSGKSTLLRALHSLADNSFTDTMVTHGCGVMQIDINTGDAHVTYTRDTKARDRKACYVVNGEEYTKLGRQQLDVVASTLKLSSVKIDSENINFNFSSQFSGPFLLLGSPSTLYSVLTYHDSFDVTRLDDLYKTDVKTIADNMKLNRKLNERLVNEDTEAVSELERLSGVPELYARVASLKAKIERLEVIRTMIERMSQLKTSHARATEVLRRNSDLQAAIMSVLIKQRDYLRLQKLRSLMTLYTGALRMVSLTDPVNSFQMEGLSRKVLNLSNLRQLCELYEQCRQVQMNVHATDGVAGIDLHSLSKKMSQLGGIKKLVLAYKRSAELQSLLSSTPDFTERFTTMQRCFRLIDLVEDARRVNMNIARLSADVENIDYEVEKIGVCPLCGQAMHSH